MTDDLDIELRNLLENKSTTYPFHAPSASQRSDRAAMIRDRISNFWRECRHNPCLMTPLSAFILLLICIVSSVTLALQVPTFVLGLLMAPLSSRMQWLVEFLYPSGLARWGHLALLRMGAKGRNGVSLDENSKTLNMHSRSIEQRTEVVRKRIYIHPLPQLLDNVGYLIVCVPPRRSNQGSPIFGILVDCGDADSVMDQIELIRDVHYAHIEHNAIEIRAVLCTHKHHDHTAGNKGLLNSNNGTLRDIYGGAIERVPYCTKKVANGDFIDLPYEGDNIMSDLVEIECVSVPSHTRGSTVYALRNKPYNNEMLSQDVQVASYLFTGDAMFSGGGGVSFESDLQFSKDTNLDNKTAHSRFKPNSGSLSIERCFAEVLRRGIQDEDAVNSSDGLAVQQMLIFPGHEYTLELLGRQMNNSNLDANSQWNRHQPSVFFELASQFFVAGHRRNLPRSTRLLTVPSSMKKELKINPYFRSLKKRGELLITSLMIWYKHLHNDKKSKLLNLNGSGVDMKYLTMPFSFSLEDSIKAAGSLLSMKSASSENTWNVNHDDLNRSVFTTVYTSDLEDVIEGLRNGRIPAQSAASKLSKLSEKLEEPAVIRRPIPSTLPSDKKMYMGLLALATLGSAPSGMTNSDSQLMNLPSPVTCTDHLLISKKRLISVLFRLGLVGVGGSSDLPKNGVDEIVLIINLLWEEARLDHDLKFEEEKRSLDYEVENAGDEDDLIELGALKLSLFSVAYHQPSWFKKYCMPCNSTPPTITKSKMKRSGGELVKHDVAKCYMCANALGCPKHNTDDDDLSIDTHTTDHTITNKRANGAGRTSGVRVVEPPTTPKRSRGNNHDMGDIELRMVRKVDDRKTVTQTKNRRNSRKR